MHHVIANGKARGTFAKGTFAVAQFANFYSSADKTAFYNAQHFTF